MLLGDNIHSLWDAWHLHQRHLLPYSRYYRDRQRKMRPSSCPPCHRRHRLPKSLKQTHSMGRHGCERQSVGKSRPDRNKGHHPDGLAIWFQAIMNISPQEQVHCLDSKCQQADCGKNNHGQGTWVNNWTTRAHRTGCARSPQFPQLYPRTPATSHTPPLDSHQQDMSEGLPPHALFPWHCKIGYRH